MWLPNVARNLWCTAVKKQSLQYTSFTLKQKPLPFHENVWFTNSNLCMPSNIVFDEERQVTKPTFPGVPRHYNIKQHMRFPTDLRLTAGLFSLHFLQFLTWAGSRLVLTSTGSSSLSVKLHILLWKYYSRFLEFRIICISHCKAGQAIYWL